MRKAGVFVLILGLMSLGAPVGLFARAAQQGSIAGEALDTGGRPLTNIPVELLQAVAGQPVGGAVQTTTTDSRGAWTFTNVEAGDYVARIMAGGQFAGIPVVVTAGVAVTNQVIVAPSLAMTSLQAGAPASGLSGGALAGIVAGVVGGILATVLVLSDGS
jgi:hypothetical protein